MSGTNLRERPHVPRQYIKKCGAHKAVGAHIISSQLGMEQ